MQTSQVQTREAIEADIEVYKETIHNLNSELILATLGGYIFWLGVVVATIAFIINAFVPIVVQQVLETIGSIAAVVSGLIGFAWVYCLFTIPRMSELFDEKGEAKKELAKLHRKLVRWDEQALRHLTSEQYMHQLPSLIASYRKQAGRYRNWFVGTQLITILLSAAITSLSGGWLDRYFQIPWIIPVIGAAISILTSITLFFKFREKGTNLQQTADAMDWEHMACTLGIGRYKGMTKEAAQVELAEQAENLRKEQQKRQLQLEQSSHAEQKALQSIP